jgi:muconolactone D-isomerase
LQARMPRSMVPEFLVVLRNRYPGAATAAETEAAVRAESERVAELFRLGHIQRLWRAADGSCNVSVWASHDEGALRSLLETLPMAPWLTWEITELVVHPSDPRAIEEVGKNRS